MSSHHSHTLLLTTVALAGAAALAPPAAYSVEGERTETPIKHVIVVIGENRSFDHVFGTYVPRDGERIANLLSEGIVNADGSPGPNFARSQQFTTGARCSSP